MKREKHSMTLTRCVLNLDTDILKMEMLLAISRSPWTKMLTTRTHE